MSQWNHPLCEECWADQHPERRPVRVKEGYRDIEACCRCGAATYSGIYVRADPAMMPNHTSHEGDE